MDLDTAIDKYYNCIYSYVYGKTGKNKSYTDECCNTVFYLFSLKQNKIADAAVYPWLIKCAANKAYEYLRKIEKDNRIVYLDEASPVFSDDTELSDRMVSDTDIEEAKERLLCLLSPEERQMYEDYYINKLTYEEIAQKLGIYRSTASKRLRIIKQRLENEAKKIFTAAGTFTVLQIISSLFER